MKVEELVALAQCGDVEAFTELVRRYQVMAFGYARATISDPGQAEDATQQAFFIAYRQLKSLRDPRRFGSWLRGIVRFECYRWIRETRQTMTTSLDSIQACDPSEGPAQLFEKQESFERTIWALDSLPEKERVVAILFYVQQHSQREVAEFLDLPVSTINNRLRSARMHLREGEFAQMSAESFGKGYRRDFAKGIGEVLKSNGPLVDAVFTRGDQPALLNSVTIESGEGVGHAAFVAQYLDDDVVRLVIPENTTIRAGMRVLDGSRPTALPLEGTNIRDVIASVRRNRPSGAEVETGIKVIDTFAPIVEAGIVAIVGDSNVGKMVLVEELFHRLGQHHPNVSILVLLHSPEEVDSIQKLKYRSSGRMCAIVLPVADASPEALASTLTGVDTMLVLSSELAQGGLYPAIDPVRSWSNLPGAVKLDVQSRARQLLESTENQPERVNLLRNYLTQPFYVAETFTGRSGEFVPKSIALNQVTQILDGALDVVPPKSVQL